MQPLGARLHRKVHTSENRNLPAPARRAGWRAGRAQESGSHRLATASSRPPSLRRSRSPLVNGRCPFAGFIGDSAVSKHGKEGGMAFAFASVPALGRFNPSLNIHGPRTVTLPALFLDRPRALPLPLSVASHSGIVFIHSRRQLPDANRHPATPLPFPFTWTYVPHLLGLPLPASTTPSPTMDGSPGPRGKKTCITNKPPRALWLCRSGPPRLRRCGRRRAPAMGSQGRWGTPPTDEPLWERRTPPPKPSSCIHCRPPVEWTSDCKHPAASIPHQEGRSPRCAVPL